MEEPPTIREIFAAAIEIDSEKERSKYLDEACFGDAALRAEIDGLIQAHCNAGSFFTDGNEATLGETVQTGHNQTHAGTWIGPYKLLKQIGEGGMGSVWMAEQQRPVWRKVALKVIKPGMDSKEVIARFEAERQALALMNHSNIAKVLDAGTTEQGRPFFVMELVTGKPITEFCDERELSLPERLDLFRDVCSAVQHAHQKGIIHRDIKPTNILVTMSEGRPSVKVIDFGVAKALNQQLTSRTLYTQFAQLLGTPLYMSPEQAEGTHDIDTRTDIYSLGVLLYELLTGTTPFSREQLRQAGLEEIRRIIREEEPARPSTKISTLGETLPSVAAVRKLEPRRLSTFMKGDLDWIVMKSLEKDRNRRYSTALAFAEDIGHHIRHEPVEATPPSVRYQFQKFAKRHKGMLTTGTLVGLSLIGGIIGTSWKAYEAEVARKQAILSESIVSRQSKEIERQRSTLAQQLAVATSNLQISQTLIDDWITRLARSNVKGVLVDRESKRLFLAESSILYKKLAEVNQGDADLLYDSAIASLGATQLANWENNLEFVGAQLQHSHSVLEGLIIRDGTRRLPYEYALAEVRTAYARYLELKGKSAAAEELRSKVSRFYSRFPDRIFDESLGEVDSAVLSLFAEHFPKAIMGMPSKLVGQCGQKDLALQVARFKELKFSSNPDVLANLGQFFVDVSRPSDAIRCAEKATKMNGENWRYYEVLGDAQVMEGNSRHAQDCYEKALSLNPISRALMLKLCRVMIDLDNFSNAKKLATRSDALKFGTGNNAYLEYQQSLLKLQLGETLGYQASSQSMLESFAESDKAGDMHFTAWTCALAPRAIENYQKAIDLAQRSVEMKPGHQQYLCGLGSILLRAGRYEEAHDILHKALDAPDNSVTSRAYIEYFTAMTAQHLGNSEDARQHLQAANAAAEIELAENPAWNRKLTLELLKGEAEKLVVSAR